MKDFVLKLWSKWTLLSIVVLGLFLRIVAINQSLWMDEAIGALVVKNQSLGQMFTSFLLADNHPPLYYVTLKLWTGVFGYSEIALRSLSVLFGLLLIVYVYKLALSIKNSRQFAAISALFVATSPFLIYYSQEARMYMMAAFFAVAAIYYFLLLIDKDERDHWILFSIYYTGLILTDYVPVFLYPLFFVYPLLKKKKLTWWIHFFLANIPLLIIGALWLPVFIAQTTNYHTVLTTLPAWSSLAGGANFKQVALIWIKFIMGRISFYQKQAYYSLVLVFSLPFFTAFYKSVKKYKENLFLWFYLVIPLALGFVVSLFFPAFTYFRFLYVVPAFFLLVASGIFTFDKKGKNVLIFLVLVVNLVCWTIYVTDKNQQREEWRQAVSYLTQNVKKGDVVILDYPEPFSPYKWYDPHQFQTVAVANSISANFKKTQENTLNAIKDRDGVYYFNYLVDLTDPEHAAKKAIEEGGFVESTKTSFAGVGQITYFVRQ